MVAYVGHRDRPKGIHRKWVSGRLSNAIITNNLVVFRTILEHSDSWDVNKRGPLGRTALHWAAKLGRVRFLELLLDRADLEATDNLGRTALSYAINAENSLAVVKLLLESGAKATGHEARHAPLRLAARRRKFDLVKRLLKEDNETLLQVVEGCGSTDGPESESVVTARRLVRCGADVQIPGLLHAAASRGCLAIFGILGNCRISRA